MAETKNKKKKRDKNRLTKGQRQTMTRARREVRMANKPALNELQRQKREGRDVYEETDTALTEINKALMNELAGIPAFGDQFAGISQGLNENIGQLGSQLGNAFGLESGEGSAAASLFGLQGATGQGLLADQQARNVGYARSVKEQGAVDLANRRVNNLEAYNDLIDEIKQGRLDIQNMKPDQILQRYDELRQSKAEMGLARKELEIGQQIANKEFGLAKKQFKSENRLQNRQQNFVEDQISDEMARKRVKNLGGRIEDVNTTLSKVLGRHPGADRVNGKWGVYETNPEVKEQNFVPIKRANKLQRQKGRLKKRRRRFRKELKD